MHTAIRFMIMLVIGLALVVTSQVAASAATAIEYGLTAALL